MNKDPENIKAPSILLYMLCVLLVLVLGCFFAFTGRLISNTRSEESKALGQISVVVYNSWANNKAPDSLADFVYRFDTALEVLDFDNIIYYKPGLRAWADPSNIKTLEYPMRGGKYVAYLDGHVEWQEEL
ncbi:MAG: hypothetical protein V3V88_02995 [Dehalococcoidia bacterium]